MRVNLLHYVPLSVADVAISKCWDKSVDPDKVCERIERVANKNKHASTIEHLVYNFDIDGISRACLQEVARHRIASYSVKSTRYTLKELKDEPLTREIVTANTVSDITNVHSDRDIEMYSRYLVWTDNIRVNQMSTKALDNLQVLINEGISNDKAKYCLPEAYKTSLVMTINARSLQNFIALRSSNSALWEIQELAKALYEALPEDHKYLFDASF